MPTARRPVGKAAKSAAAEAAKKAAEEDAAQHAAADAPEGEGHQSWDAFWAEVQRQELEERGEQATETIRGVVVVVPHDLPMRFQRRMDVAQDREKGVKARLAELEADSAELRAKELRDPTVDYTEERQRIEDARAELVSDAAAMNDTKNLLSDLFGQDVLDQWIESGMTEREFSTVLLWGMAHGKGQEITFLDAYQAVRDAEGNRKPAGAAGPADAPPRSSKPTAKRKRPAATGGRSSRTSRASTT